MPALDLRPLSLGELLDRTFFLYRRNFFLFIGIAAIPYSIFFVLNLATSLVPFFLRSGATDRMAGAGLAAAAVGGGLFALIALRFSRFPKFTRAGRLPSANRCGGFAERPGRFSALLY